jgi:hypothetical protein
MIPTESFALEVFSATASGERHGRSPKCSIEQTTFIHSSLLASLFDGQNDMDCLKFIA